MADPLSDFQWEHRLIVARVVGEADAATAERSRLVRVFGENESDILERHILWFVLKGDVVESNVPERLPDDFARKLDAAGYWHDAVTVLNELFKTWLSSCFGHKGSKHPL